MQRNLENSSIRIYVAQHNRNNEVLSLKGDHYILMHCGKASFHESDKKGYLPEFGDDTGDNISAKNGRYCELTALYWIWKNDDSGPDDIVGIEHYRRHFKDTESSNELISPKTIRRILTDYDYISTANTPPNAKLEYNDPCPVNDSLYAGYKQCHVISDLDNCLEFIGRNYPNLYDGIRQLIYHSSSMCCHNMMITTKKLLDEYCEFLFPVLKYAESKVPENDWISGNHSGYNGRAMGFIAERLFRAWLVATGHTSDNPGLINWEKYSGYRWE